MGAPYILLSEGQGAYGAFAKEQMPEAQEIHPKRTSDESTPAGQVVHLLTKLAYLFTHATRDANVTHYGLRQRLY